MSGGGGFALPPMGPFAPGGTTWNPRDNSSAALTNGNLTATFNSVHSTFNGIRSSSNKTSGKWMFVCQIGMMDNVGGWALGVANSLAPLTRPGDTQDSVGAQFAANSNQLITYGTAIVLYPMTSATRDQIGVCVDADLGLIWWNDFTQRSGWTDRVGGFTGNPTLGYGGTELGFDPTQGVYIMGAGYYGIVTADALILNPQCFGFTDAIPNFFSSWDVLTIGFTVAEPC